MGVVPIEGELFEDFIDGYFPLNVSLGHMLDRHGFASAWILMRVAPMMDIPDLAETEPVPLHLDPAHGGQIDWLSATIRLSGQTASLSGQARWNWNDPLKTKKDKIPTTLRLAEPAFLRGVGFPTGDLESRSLGKVKRNTNGSATLFLSEGQTDGQFTSHDMKKNLEGALCWSIGFSQGLSELDLEELKPWANPYSPKRSSNSQEVLFLRDTDDPINSHIISDSLACF